MLSPDGFESMSGLARKAVEFGLEPDQFVQWVVGLTDFHLADPSNINLPPVKCDPVAIQFIDNVPVFFDVNSWVLSLEKLRAAAAAIDERQVEDYRTGQFLLIPEGNDKFHHLSDGELQFLAQLEGRILVVGQVAADTLNTFANASKRKRFTDTAKRNAAYNAWLDTFPGRSPTIVDRENWRNAHGITRDKERYELWEKYKPADGSKPGVKPKTG
ncbi:hypothetical protein AB1A64_13290 [Ruegeria sp. ANG10]|uniref:hypothetical protein n=1 Tax=Ruegeria sp. ANG10 TaxID=3042467 RepID=UPI003454687C